MWSFNKQDSILFTNTGTSYFSPDIEFDLINKTVSIIYEDFRESIEEKFEVSDYSDVFPLGELFISFLEMDFERYNKLLLEYSRDVGEYLIRASFHDFLYGFSDFLNKHNILHPYFESLDHYAYEKSRGSITVEDFNSIMTINTKKIATLKSFLSFLSGNPCNTLESTEESPREYLSRCLYEIFSSTPPLKSRLHCRFQVNNHTSLIEECRSGFLYNNQHPVSFCITELSKMLEAGIVIKQCKNCGNFFIPQNNHAVDYCDRPYKNTGKSCKEVGANRKYKNKVYKNPILQEYERAYKRNYAKCKRNAIDAESFRQWIDDATIERDRVATEYEKSNDIAILDAFKKYLGNK